MAGVRRAAVAGRFYPADAEELRRDVERYIAEGEPAGTPPKAIVVPHAGYMFSGPVAGSGYAQVVPLKDTVKRVVLLGPAHYVPINGLGVSSASAFETPLGEVPVDTEAVEELLQMSQVHVADDAHQPEHSLEVHLPFLHVALGDFRLVPLLVGKASAEDVTAVLEQLWNGPETLVVISSDLSHFHDYDSARQIDGETSRAIAEMRPEDLHGKRACGFLPISGLLAIARQRHLMVKALDLRNSGDTAGPRDRVVGYGAFSIF